MCNETEQRGHEPQPVGPDEVVPPIPEESEPDPIREALQEIMRQASYLPRWSTTRRVIEEATNSALRDGVEG